MSQLATPSRDDPIVAGASRLVGGPLGRFASSPSRWWFTPVRALLVLTVLTCVLGFLAKAPCRTHPWSNEYQYTRVCYTDVFALYYAEKLGAKVAAVSGRGDAYTLAVAISETLRGVKLLPGPDARSLKWSEIVEEKRETWPIQYLLPSGAYIH